MTLPNILIIYVEEKTSKKNIIGLDKNNPGELIKFQLDKEGNICNGSYIPDNKKERNFLKKLGKYKLERIYEEDRCTPYGYILNLANKFIAPISFKQATFYLNNPNCLPHILNSIYARHSWKDFK